MNLKDYPVTTFTIAIILVAFTYIMLVAVPNMLPDISAQPTIDKNMTYMPHYVKFHIYPEQEGIVVRIVSLDDLSLPSGVVHEKTDNNSEIVLSMYSNKKYYIAAPERNISVYIYPKRSEYYLIDENNY